MQVTITSDNGKNIRQAPDVVDETLYSDMAGRMRGEYELEKSVSKNVMTATGPAELYETGLHFRVGDAEDGLWDGMLKFCQLVLEMGEDGFSFTASSSMTFNRPKR